MDLQHRVDLKERRLGEVHLRRIDTGRPGDGEQESGHIGEVAVGHRTRRHAPLDHGQTDRHHRPGPTHD